MEHEWLGDLEQRVEQAAEELRRLRHENQRLETRVADLEQELAASDEGESWGAERDEIRRRVESLAEGLEKLLGEEDESSD